jgi:pimeloyl-ACP methyl ester carboxylesterase
VSHLHRFFELLSVYSKTEENMKETLALIPGFANNALAWKHQSENLQDLFDIQVLVMDKHVTRKEMVEFLLHQLPPQFILAGHSMGGWVAQAVAAIAPERVNKLILLNTWATPDPKMIFMQKQINQGLKQGRFDEMVKQYLPLLIHPSRLKDLDLLHSLQTMVASFSLNTLIQQQDAMLQDYSSLHLLHAIKAPTLVIHSQNDALFNAKELQAIATGISNSQVSILKETGHASPLEKPEVVTNLIRTFSLNKH